MASQRKKIWTLWANGTLPCDANLMHQTTERGGRWLWITYYLTTNTPNPEREIEVVGKAHSFHPWLQILWLLLREWVWFLLWSCCRIWSMKEHHQLFLVSLSLFLSPSLSLSISLYLCANQCEDLISIPFRVSVCYRVWLHAGINY